MPAAGAPHASDPSAPSQVASPSPPPPPPPTWEQADRLLRVLFERNRLYATIAGLQAVRLLLYARALFLRTTSTPESPGSLNTENQSRANTTTTILVLPAELQISILHYLVPVLSPAQCHRVCRYVSFRPIFNPHLITLFKPVSDHPSTNTHTYTTDT